MKRMISVSPIAVPTRAELGSLSLAIVLGVAHDSLYDSNVLLVDHSHGVQCLLLARSV